MTTRFGLFCEGLLEGIWLIALIVAPLYFNSHTVSPFEPNKSSLIRGLALLMLIIYLIRLMEGKTSSQIQKPGITSLRRHSAPPPEIWNAGGSGASATNVVPDLYIRPALPARPNDRPVGRAGRRTWAHPIVIAGLILGGCYLFSTIISVTPRTSWWGNYSRAQGTYTLLSYVVIFFITFLTLRKQAQLERMVTTIILTSFPIVIYGFSQALRLDVLPWGTGVSTRFDVGPRVISTTGNPIYLGAYFIMVIPLTLVRLINSLRHLANQRRTKLSRPLGRGSPLATYLPVFLYALLLLLQIVCLVLTQSRGPFVGLIVGLFFFFVLTALLYQRKKLALLIYGLAVLLILFLVVLNLPQTPLEPLKKIPYIGRLSRVFETETGSGKVRLLIWEGVINRVKTGGFRNFIGSGPEMMGVLYYRYYPFELVRFEGYSPTSQDRSHNELFDTLINTGFIGAFVYLFFVGIIIFYILKWLGLFRTRFQTLFFLILCVVGSLAGIILPRLLQGSYIFSGVGIPLGLVSAVAVYILMALFQAPDKLGHSVNPVRDSRSKPSKTKLGDFTSPVTEISNGVNTYSGLILIGLASALIAHFIETQFGIAVTATRTYFWLFAAMLVPTGYFIQTNLVTNLSSKSSPSNPAETPQERRSDTRLVLPAANKQRNPASYSTMLHPSRREEATTSLTFYALIVGFILSTIFYSRVPTLTNPFFNSLLVGEIVLALLFSVIFINVVRTSTASLPRRRAGLKDYTILLIFSTVYVLIFVLILSLFLPPSFYFPPSIPTAYLSVIPVFYLWVLLTIILLARSIYPEEIVAESTKTPKERRSDVHLGLLTAKKYHLKLIRGGNLIIYVLLIGSAFIWIFYSLIRPLQGNILYKRGVQSEELKRWDESLSYYQQAIDWSVDGSYYYSSMAGVFMEKCNRETNPDIKTQVREQCKEFLLNSLEYEPLCPERNTSLGRFYRKWALDSLDETERQHGFQEALKYYKQACCLNPYNLRLLNEWGDLYVNMKQYKKAIEKYESSERQDKTFVETYARLGNVYSILNNIPEASKYYERAALLYRTSKMKLRHPSQENLFIHTHVHLIKYQPKNYLGYYNLARYEWDKKNYQRCLDLAKRGRNFAPPTQQQILDQYIKHIEATKKDNQR